MSDVSNVQRSSTILTQYQSTVSRTETPDDGSVVGAGTIGGGRSSLPDAGAASWNVTLAFSVSVSATSNVDSATLGETIEALKNAKDKLVNLLQWLTGSSVEPSKEAAPKAAAYEGAGNTPSLTQDQATKLLQQLLEFANSDNVLKELIKNSNAGMQAARLQSQAESNSAIAETRASADATRLQGVMQLASGVVQGGFQIAGGVAQIKGAGQALKTAQTAPAAGNAGSGAGAGAGGAGAAGNRAAASNRDAISRAQSEEAAGYGVLLSGIGSVIGKALDGGSTIVAARATDHQAEAELHRSRKDEYVAVLQQLVGFIDAQTRQAEGLRENEAEQARVAVIR